MGAGRARFEKPKAAEGRRSPGRCREVMTQSNHAKRLGLRQPSGAPVFSSPRSHFGVTLDDIAHRIEFLAAIQKGLDQVKRGEVVPHEQVKKELASWLSK
jgi:hypothetical protein